MRLEVREVLDEAAIRWLCLLTVLLFECVICGGSTTVHAQTSATPGAIAGSVLDDAGKPVAGAKVILTTSPAGDPVSETNTDKNGYFQFTKLNPISYRLGIASPEGSDLVGDDKVLYSSGKETATVVTVPSGKIVRVTRRLEKGGRIEIRLVRRGQPWFGDCPCDFKLSRGQALYLGNVGIASDFFFFFNGLAPADDYQVTFEPDGYVTRRSFRVAVRRAETTRVAFEHDPDDPTGLQGTLKTAEGAPLRDVFLFARPEGITSRDRYVGQSKSNANGRFKIVGLPPGVYLLDAMTALNLARVTVVAGTITTVDLVWGQQASSLKRTSLLEAVLLRILPPVDSGLAGDVLFDVLSDRQLDWRSTDGDARKWRTRDGPGRVGQHTQMKRARRLRPGPTLKGPFGYSDWFLGDTARAISLGDLPRAPGRICGRSSLFR